MLNVQYICKCIHYYNQYNTMEKLYIAPILSVIIDFLDPTTQRQLTAFYEYIVDDNTLCLSLLCSRQYIKYDILIMFPHLREYIKYVSILKHNVNCSDLRDYNNLKSVIVSNEECLMYLPDYIEELIFRDIAKHRFLCHNIPKNIKILVLSGDHECFLDEAEILPIGLEHITFSPHFFEKLNKYSLPNTIKTITLGHKYTSEISRDVIPDQTEEIIFVEYDDDGQILRELYRIYSFGDDDIKVYVHDGETKIEMSYSHKSMHDDYNLNNSIQYWVL